MPAPYEPVFFNVGDISQAELDKELG